MNDDLIKLIVSFNKNFDFFKTNFSCEFNQDNHDHYVAGNFPIVWFGDLENYFKSQNSLKIVTIGANPSDNEFKRNRFTTDLAYKNMLNISTQDIDNEINFFNNYFTNTEHIPTNYFAQMEKLLNEAFKNIIPSADHSLTYKHSRMIHMDAFSAIATNPKWGELKKDTNTPTTADVLAFANSESLQLFNQHVNSPFNFESGRVLEDRLYRYLDPDITIFMGTLSYFEQRVYPKFTHNSPQNIIYESSSTSNPKAKIYIKEEGQRKTCLIFKRNSPSNYTFHKDLQRTLDSADSKNYLDFIKDKLF